MTNTTTPAVDIAFDNSYARLPPQFYALLNPTPVAKPALIRLNEPLARHLGLEPAELASPEGIDMLAGNRVPAGAQPLAMAYAGHQFGSWVPQLGQRQDIQLKGAGRTPFSRMGDGRAWVGPVLREYVVSEAMSALGIPTTRALAAVLTGEAIMREGEMPGAVLTRVARSHIRVGTFQFFASRGDNDALRALTEHVIARHYPHAADVESPALSMLHAVIGRQAELIARWQAVGFIHGVMNTDNASIAGDTIDYGPCAFMDTYHPEKVFSSIDQMSRYAYQNQPGIAQWNCANLAQCLLPLINDDGDAAVAAAQTAIDTFPAHFATAYLNSMQAKLGLENNEDDDLALVSDLLEVMASNTADFTLTFRALSQMRGEFESTEADSAARQLFDDPKAFDQWAKRWRERLVSEPRSDAQRQTAMRAVNPAFIPRNHRVEAVIQAAVQDDDFAPFNELLGVVSRPYDDQPEQVGYMDPPRPDQVVRQTFCGT